MKLSEELSRFGLKNGYQIELNAYLNPFSVDKDVFSSPSRTVSSRMHWRDGVLAIARQMLADGGYESFTIRSLAQKTGSSPQTIFNNLGRKDHILSQAILQCKRQWLESPLIINSNIHTCGKALFSRYLMSLHYSDFCRAILECIRDSAYIRETMLADFQKRISSSLFLTGHCDHVRVSSFLISMLTDVAKVTGFDWLSGKTSAYEMLENSLDGTNWCMAGSNEQMRVLHSRSS